MTVFAGDLIYASDLARVVARGRRTTSTAAFTTTETGVLRVDDIPVYAGKAYHIYTSGINLDTAVTDDIATARLRVETSGAATTSSTQIAQMRNTIDDPTSSNVIPLSANYYPAADATLSVLLSAVRVAGSGNIVVFCSSTDILDLVIEEIGDDPGDTGVVI